MATGTETAGLTEVLCRNEQKTNIETGGRRHWRRVRGTRELNLVHGLIFTSLAVGWIPSRAAVIVAADQTQKNNAHRW